MTAAPLKILAIDDEQLLLWALERAFKGRELQISTAATSEQALNKIELNHYDLFLLDFDLKDKSSQDVLKKIDERYPYVPVIIMTTSDVKSCELNDAIRSVRKQGAWHLLEKPFRLERLTSFVELIFSEQSSIKLCLSDLTHNYDNEKRNHVRRSHVLSMDLKIKQIIDGKTEELTTQSILTDISECGVGLLSRIPLKKDQLINFGGDMKELYGIVAWSRRIEANTYRAGIRMC